MRIEKYLDAVMTAKGFTQDKELAHWLRVTAPAISQYRKGVRTMSNEQCVAIALELKIDPLQVIMATDLDKAERAGQKSLWEVFSQRMATTAASVILTVVAASTLLSPSDVNANNRSSNPSQFDPPFQEPFLKFDGKEFATTIGLDSLKCKRHFIHHRIQEIQRIDRGSGRI